MKRCLKCGSEVYVHQDNDWSCKKEECSFWIEYWDKLVTYEPNELFYGVADCRDNQGMAKPVPDGCLLVMNE